MFYEISEYEVGSESFSNGGLKHFYRKMEKIFELLDPAATTVCLARSFINSFLDQLGPMLAVTRIHLYDCLSGASELTEVWGIAKDSVQLKLETVPLELPWVGLSKDNLLAILPVGDDPSMLMVFFADRGNNQAEEQEFHSYFDRAFSSIHYALVQNLRRLEMQDEFYQAKAIQLSLLPSHPPTFAEFDIAAECVPAQLVGGDMYDYQFFARGSLAIAITDAAGHGLPAALQARDVITGFRMGVRSEMGVTEIAEKLNYVIHQGGLSSRFVSLVLGELWRNGTFKYVNAGHPRPLLLTDRSFIELGSGGDNSRSVERLQLFSW